MPDYTNVDPGMVQFLEGFYENGGAPLSLETMAEARSMLGAFPEMFDAPSVEVGKVRDLQIDGADGKIAARLFVPENAPANNVGLVFYHGGGWMLGDIASHDRTCRRLCKTGGLTILAVDYRLAPEHVFPSASDDAEAAFLWACDNAKELGIAPNRLAVGGDSAGGNLSASVALSLRGNPRGEPAFQLLIYPAVDMFDQSLSYERYGEGYFLDKSDMDFFIGTYLGENVDKDDPRHSPMAAADKSGAPPAYIITAGFDPLCDQGAAYAKALEGVGVNVVYKNYPSMIHGFLSMTGLSTAALTALEEAARATGEALAEIT